MRWRWTAVLGSVAMLQGAVCGCVRDHDGDGDPDDVDCAPEDPTAFHGAAEACFDGVDNDCDGEVDPGCYSKLSVAAYRTCGLRGDGEIDCWGPGFMTIPARPPEGPFTDLDGGRVKHCAIRRDATLSCWGEGRVVKIPEGEFIDVAAGGPAFQDMEYAFYAVDGRGKLAVWNCRRPAFGHCASPDGRFSAVTTGLAFTCGLLEDHTVACWGVNDVGQSSPPRGEFTQLDAGEIFACGLRAGGEVVCWGDPEAGRLEPPESRYSEVSVADRFACALTTDGDIRCWGEDTTSGYTPPAGPFTAVSAGLWQICGLRPDGHATCWGCSEKGAERWDSHCP